MYGMTLDIKKKFQRSSDRVKAIDQHPKEPWVLVSLYCGQVHIYNYKTEALVKQFEASDLPVRTAKFIERKQWVICAADDMHIRAYNYNTTETVKKFEAHTDYIRSLAVHPNLPYVLSSSDDMTIKLWDWDKNWQCIRTFEGHTHYVMRVAFNPKDPNTFASASLDRTVKVWGLTTNTPHFTLEGREAHSKGVNCVTYYPGGEKPYLVTGSDDKTVKIWDYQTKACVQTLEGHSNNVSAVEFHPELPIIISASEDGTVRMWNSNTYRLEKVLSYNLERAWCISCKRGTNTIALGYDDGTVLLKMGREVPAASMDYTGKIIFARQTDVFTANVRATLESGASPLPDGEPISLAKRELGTSEVYPQIMEHGDKGRFCAVSGDGQWTIYDAVGWRSKAFGNGLEFVWGPGKGQYAVRETNSKIKIFNDFNETLSFRTDFNAEGIFGGWLIGIKSNEFLCFYDWRHGFLVKQIDISPKGIYWNESGELVGIAAENSFFILKFNKTLVTAAIDSGQPIPEDGIEDAFAEDIVEINEKVRTGKWEGDCFIYTNSSNKLNYCVGSLVETVAHFDRQMYFLGYIAKFNRVFLLDKSLNIIPYTLNLSVINYQTAVLRRDFRAAEAILPKIANSDRMRIAHFLESQGHKKQAVKVSIDPDHKFELAIQLGDLKLAKEIAESETDTSSSAQSFGGTGGADHKWRQIANLALAKWEFELAEVAMWHCDDLNGLLLLYSSVGNAVGMEKLATRAQLLGKHNVAFTCLFLLNRVGSCLELLIKDGRLPEAAFLARSYAPSQVSNVVNLWRQDLSKTNSNIAKALADPAEYPNLFTESFLGIQAEKMFRPKLNLDLSELLPATDYLKHASMDVDLLEEAKKAQIVQQEKEQEQQIPSEPPQENPQIGRAHV